MFPSHAQSVRNVNARRVGLEPRLALDSPTSVACQNGSRAGMAQPVEPAKNYVAVRRRCLLCVTSLTYKAPVYVFSMRLDLYRVDP